MNDKINKIPVTYEDWIDLGRVIIPCDTKQAVVEKWSSPDFKITKEEWKTEHSTKQIGLRLDQYNGQSWWYLRFKLHIKGM